MIDLVVNVGDLLDEEADVIIVPANPWLNLSGGVNGALLARGGESVQAELHSHLRDLGKSAVEAGTVVATGPGPLCARVLLHAVAIDPFYDSSSEIVERTVRQAFAKAVECQARAIAMPALATGYGRLSMEQFAVGFVSAVAADDWRPIQRVVVVVRRPEDAETIRRAANGKRS